MAQSIRPRIGVLAIQGDYAAHAEALSDSGAEPSEIRKPEQLADIDGLILPGGESTTMLKFLEKCHFFEALKISRAQAGLWDMRRSHPSRP